ncbi:hypothetical protein GCM10010245_79640 [Streptomyces spectabilis]|uniref:Uncharacterized protein n=1 Tax=Streptomyces spectabilis TaxID=68270 RepID=A0A7W8B2A7_STRST|nr:hypothetical protein [Streptomyces spectabilis]GGV50538.1 hypothetical protein GCM10010245_79640 [Streptomyces spectabilis]
MPALVTPPGTQLRFDDPLPAALRHGPVDVVRVSMGVGIPALNAMLRQGQGMPVLCCPAHHVMHVPVPAGTASAWRAPHSVCLPGTQWGCADLRYGPPQPYDARVLVLPARPAGDAPAPAGSGVASPEQLFHALSLTRSALRQGT